MKILLMNSGGYDSTVCLHLLKSLGHEVTSGFVEYGQRSLKQERGSAIANSDRVGANFKSFYVDLAFAMSSKLYIPQRNLVLLSMGLSYAESKDYEAVAFGFHKHDDESTYFCDNSPDFFYRMKEQANLAGIELLAPLLYANKKEVYTLGNKLGIDLKNVWSCDFPSSEGKRCGKCDKCEDEINGATGVYWSKEGNENG